MRERSEDSEKESSEATRINEEAVAVMENKEEIATEGNPVTDAEEDTKKESSAGRKQPSAMDAKKSVT